MVVTENWIPFEHSYDAALLDALTRGRASYLKGLRYNLPTDRPLASVVLREDGAAPVAMYVVPPDADEAYRRALEELTDESEMTAWVWNAGVAEMPPLPIMSQASGRTGDAAQCAAARARDRHRRPRRHCRLGEWRLAASRARTAARPDALKEFFVRVCCPTVEQR